MHADTDKFIQNTMKKNLFLTALFASLFALCSMAQTIGHSGNVQHAPRKAHIDPEVGQAWWGYFIDDNQYSDFGTEGTDTYNCAIYIPGDHELAKDSKVYAERLWLKRNCNIADMKIWLSTELPASAEAANVVCKPVTVTKGGIVDFAFDEPYQIDNKGVYVGYSFTINKIESDDDKWPVYTTAGLDMVQNAMFVSWSSGKWYSNFDLCNTYGGNWGNLCMHVLLGDGFYSYAAAIKSVGTGVVAIGNTVDVPVTVENYGGTDIYDFDYTVTYDGKESEPMHYDTGEHPIIGTLNRQTYKLPLTAAKVTGESKALVKITQVNGGPNELNDGHEQAEANILTVAKRVARRTVMENFLNTGDDGYAVLSHVANDRLSHDWHNEFESSIVCGGNHNNYIGIMIHDRDGFATNDYIKTCLELDDLKAVTQYPFIFTDVDRENRVLNYFGSQYYDQYNRRTKFGIEDDFGASQSETVEADVQIWTRWKTDNVIQSTVSTTFGYSADDAHYALAFALVEDGKVGPINNYILPMTYQGAMFQWDPEVWETYVKGPDVIDNVVFNDVLVATDEIYEGIAGSIKAPIKEGDTQYYQHNFDLSYNTTIQNKENLKVIVMLIDTKSGRIVNANRVHVGEDSEELGISTIETNTDNAPSYDLTGRRVTEAYKGLVIQNGKKVMK